MLCASNGHHVAGHAIDASSEAAPREAAHMLARRGRRGLGMRSGRPRHHVLPLRPRPDRSTASPEQQRRFPAGPARPAGGAPAARPARVSAVPATEALCLPPLRLKAFPGQQGKLARWQARTLRFLRPGGQGCGSAT